MSRALEDVPGSLKRYTELPYVLQALQDKEITLLSPASWDDENDAHYVQRYKERAGLKTVLALCLTEARQTYHHWRIFTHGASGACIWFKRDKFESWVKEVEGLSGRSVKYKTVPQLQKNPPDIGDLAFIKRQAYENEKEFRLLYESKASVASIKSFPFSVDMVERIVINPWLPVATVNSMGKIIRSIDGCQDLDVVRATIVSNKEWKEIADSV